MKLSLPRLGLAGGIDRDGSRAAELLAAGFGSVEFGTVTPDAQPGCHSSVALLVQRLAALAPHAPDTRNNALIGIGLGLGQGAQDSLAAGADAQPVRGDDARIARRLPDRSPSHRGGSSGQGQERHEYDETQIEHCEPHRQPKARQYGVTLSQSAYCAGR